jgi:predicted SAM-dependent methyltransferase
MWRRLAKRCTTAGFRRALRNLQLETIGLVRHGRGIRAARRYYSRDNLRLNLGCGPNTKSGWLNIDYSGAVDLTLDLRERLPFRSGSCKMIYTEHFLEHLDYPDDALPLLSECFRVLAVGGIIRIGVPDTQWPLLEYAKVRDEGYFEHVKVRWHPSWCHTEMEHINFHFRQGNQHRFAYDYDTLASALAKAGFVNVERREFDPEIDSKERALGTLYVEASKPPSAEIRSD